MTGRFGILSALCALLVSLAAPAAAWTKCTLDYELRGWAILYKTSRGNGRVTCTNGQSASVGIVTHGGGFSVGGFEIIDGEGRFSSVRDIAELFGVYIEADAHAGAGAAADARVMTKGDVSLLLAGRGQGVNLGIAVGTFRMEPR